MPTRPEALRLADLLESCPLAVGDAQQAVAAAELRRLHAENERLSATVKAREDEILTHSEAFYEATRLLSEEREKNERLATEVANRNRRALAGDEAVSALANVHAYYEKLEAQRDALLERIKAVIAAEQSEGAGRGGFVNTPPTREHQRRVAQAWQELHAAIKAVEETK